MNKIAIEIYRHGSMGCKFADFEDMGHSEQSWEDLSRVDQSDLVNQYIKGIYKDEEILVMKWYNEYCSIR